jgi:hypothetical protein
MIRKVRRGDDAGTLTGTTCGGRYFTDEVPAHEIPAGSMPARRRRPHLLGEVHALLRRRAAGDPADPRPAHDRAPRRSSRRLESTLTAAGRFELLNDARYLPVVVRPTVSAAHLLSRLLPAGSGASAESPSARSGRIG